MIASGGGDHHASSFRLGEAGARVMSILNGRRGSA